MSGVVFTSVWINNFMAISSAEVVMDNRGLVFIEGENQDDPSAASNGAGKSSLVDALPWALYGVTARGVTGDAVINRKAGRDCEVSVGIEVDGERWLIERGRKSKRWKNRVFLKHFDAALGDWVDHTLGTDKLTQERIDALLGCNAKTFNEAVYMGQEAMPDLPAMTDKALKSTLEQALGLDRLDEAQSIANIRLENAKRAVYGNTTALDGWVEQLRKTNEKVADLHGALSIVVSEIAHLQGEIDLADSERETNIKLTKETLDAYQSDLEKLEGDLKTAVRNMTEMETSPAMVALMAEMDKITVRNARLHDALVETKVAWQEARRIAQSTEPNCGECGRPHDNAEELEKHRAAKSIEMDELGKKIKTIQDMMTQVTHDGAKNNNERYNLRAHGNAQVDMLEHKILRMTSLVITAKENHDKAKSGLHGTTLLKWRDEKFNRKVEMQKDLLRFTDAIDTLTKNVAMHQVALEESAARVDTLERVKHVLSRKGFRGEVLDQVTPYLNARTQYYLTWLTSDNITATWNTVNITSSGELSESFHIDVAHREGSESFEGLSGGEKRKVRLACAMALQDLVGTRAVKPIKLFIADEIDDAIDDSGLELLMGLLEEKAKSVGTLMIISHNALGDWCKESIVMVKKDGVTTIK